MRIRLESRTAKLFAVAVTALLLGPYCSLAGIRYLAARAAQKDDRVSLERAVSLVPHNAEFRERLARRLLFSEQDAQGALRNFTIAATLNPYSATSWLGVAQSQLILGNESASLDAVQHAIQVDPTTPSVAWESATLLVASGQTEPALREIRFVLANDPALLLQGLQLVRRLEPSAARAAQVALPPDPAIHFSYINLLVRSGEMGQAKKAWPVVIGLHKPFDPKLSFFFLNALVQSREAQAAVQYWNELGKSLPAVARLNQPGNLVHNAGFEFDILNGGFDWLYAPSGEVNLQAETSDFHEGRRSLLVTFLGQRTTDIGMHQYVLLEPNTRYRFRGFMKSDLQTANGLQFMLVDLANNNHLFETADSVDDRHWREFSAEFTTARNTGLCILLMGRTSRSLIRGNILVDDIRLEKAAQ